ncbi:hypothetical protein CMV_010159 [Castanea mollissima]|uniref:Uncharacterized protein n=1 Tax=Castanea mollissima TaxID=60419 RepID=A0A8J4RNC5_9ROSI|nr:hypothetical protein CMV_010159 [Castanea mollissima]
MGMTVSGYYISRKKPETTIAHTPMEAEVNVNSDQLPTILKEKEQTGGLSATNSHGASPPFTNELKGNVQNNINCKVELQSQMGQNNNCGVNSTFKTDMNSESLMDPPQQDLELHSTFINT